MQQSRCDRAKFPLRINDDERAIIDRKQVGDEKSRTLAGTVRPHSAPRFGEATAELLDEGFIEIEFEHHNGDDAVLKAKREPFSTTC
jgi:hypothetical protein